MKHTERCHDVIAPCSSRGGQAALERALQPGGWSGVGCCMPPSPPTPDPNPAPPAAAVGARLLLHFDLRVLLPLHPSVLEPDFDLPLVQTQGVRDLDAPAATEVAVEVELFLQLQSLVAGVTGPGALTLGF